MTKTDGDPSRHAPPTSDDEPELPGLTDEA